MYVKKAENVCSRLLLIPYAPQASPTNRQIVLGTFAHQVAAHSTASEYTHARYIPTLAPCQRPLFSCKLPNRISGKVEGPIADFFSSNNSYAVPPHLLIAVTPHSCLQR
jgi:hypothetical protein